MHVTDFKHKSECNHIVYAYCIRQFFLASCNKKGKFSVAIDNFSALPLRNDIYAMVDLTHDSYSQTKDCF